MLKKDHVAKLGLFIINFITVVTTSLFGYMLEKPFNRGVKFSSLKTTKSQ